MARKIYIIKKGMKIEDAYAEAERLGIGEICQGIPPRLELEGLVKEQDLPCVYEEPIIPAEKPRDYNRELDELKEEIRKLKDEK